MVIDDASITCLGHNEYLDHSSYNHPRTSQSWTFGHYERGGGMDGWKTVAEVLRDLLAPPLVKRTHQLLLEHEHEHEHTDGVIGSAAVHINGDAHLNGHSHSHPHSPLHAHRGSSVHRAPPGRPKFPHLKSLTVSALRCTVESWRALLESAPELTRLEVDLAALPEGAFEVLFGDVRAVPTGAGLSRSPSPGATRLVRPTPAAADACSRLGHPPPGPGATTSTRRSSC